MLDLRRLRALRELSTHGTIAGAADALHLTPSAVSQQIATLEREIGRQVAEPHGRSVRLTPAAEIVLTHADALFAQVELLRADLDTAAAGRLHEVRVAAFASAIAAVVAPAARMLAAGGTGPSLRVVEMEAPEAFRGLASGTLDVVVSMECDGAPRATDARFTRVELCQDILDVALPADHPLAGRREVPLAALAAEAWIAPPSGWSCDQVVQGGCRTAGCSPDVHHRCGDWSVAVSMVGAGLGVTLGPRLAQSEPPPGVALRPLAAPAPVRHLFAACARGAEQRPALKATFEAFSSVLASG